MNSDKDVKPAEPREGGLFPLALGLTLAAGLAAVLTRLLTASGMWPWNMTAVGALGLYGGARLRSWWALALPLAVMAVTDIILLVFKNYPPFNPFVYGSFLVYVLLGRLLARRGSPVRVGAACVLGSVQFFLLTNLGAWLAQSRPVEAQPGGRAIVWEERGGAYLSPVYARNVEGLLACYAAALPFTNKDAPPLGFFGNLLLGDLFFCGLLFGAHALLARRYFPAGLLMTGCGGSAR